MDRPNLLRGTAGGGVLIILGWYATLIAAIAVGVTSVPSPPTDCTTMSFCLSPGQGLLLGAVFIGVPLFVVAFPVATISVFMLMRRLSSAVVAGTISAAIGLVVPLIAFAAWNGVR